MTVYLVGAGPGDPALITVRGAELLARADVVFEEVVEGNITRLVGVFHSKAPGRIRAPSSGRRPPAG